jgi:hypothetical protein
MRCYTVDCARCHGNALGPGRRIPLAKLLAAGVDPEQIPRADGAEDQGDLWGDA